MPETDVKLQTPESEIGMGATIVAIGALAIGEAEGFLTTGIGSLILLGGLAVVARGAYTVLSRNNTKVEGQQDIV